MLFRFFFLIYLFIFFFLNLFIYFFFFSIRAGGDFKVILVREDVVNAVH